MSGIPYLELEQRSRLPLPGQPGLFGPTVAPASPPPSSPPPLVVPGKATLKLYPFQEEGVRWLQSRESALLADDMGLGKTPMSIYWGAERSPALVVVPAALVYNWEREIKEKWRPGDSVTVLLGQPLPHKLLRWTIVTYGGLGHYLKQLQRAGFRSIICDEAHLIKSMEAQRTRNVLALVETKPEEGQPIPSRLAVTGSPIMNRPPELYSLLRYLGQQVGSQEAFTSQYVIREAARGGVMVVRGYKDLDKLHARIQPFTLRRLKRDVLTQLPPKIYRPIYTAITNAAEYTMAQRDFLRWLELTVGKEAVENLAFKQRAMILVRLNYLRKLAAVGKVGPVRDFLRPCDDTGHKVIIWSNFLEVIDSLNKAKPGVVYTGSRTKEEREAIVQQFQKDPAVCYFYGTIAAGGVGITLTAADRVVFVDLPWTPAAKVQAEDRAHRIGQQRTVEVIPFLAKGTVDERIMELIAEKEQVISQAVDGLSVDRALAESVTNKLLKNLLSTVRMGQKIAPPPQYISDEDAETLQGYRQEPPAVRVSGICKGALPSCSITVKAAKEVRAVATSPSELADAIAEVRRLFQERIGGSEPAQGDRRQTFAIGPTGRRYDLEYRVIEANSAITSHNPFTFELDPRFTASLQPRVRERAAAQAQVLRIASALDPDQLLIETHTLDRGAPILGSDMLVESGNGRVMGVKRAAQENKAVYEKYRAALLDRATLFGLQTQDVNRFSTPVLLDWGGQQRQGLLAWAHVQAAGNRTALIPLCGSCYLSY